MRGVCIMRGEMRNIRNVSEGEPERNRPHGRTGVDERVVSTRKYALLEKLDVCLWTRFTIQSRI